MKYTCIQCGHVWRARSERMPQQCPLCKSLKWNNADIMTRSEMISELNALYAIVYLDYIRVITQPHNEVDYSFINSLTLKQQLRRLEYRFGIILDSDIMPAYIIGEIMKGVSKA